MDNLEEKIKELLQNPEEMAKIVALASSFLGSQNAAAQGGANTQNAVPAFAPQQGSSGPASSAAGQETSGPAPSSAQQESSGPAPSAAGGGPAADRRISPELLNMVSGLMAGQGNAPGGHGERINLISAVKPFLSDDYRGQIDRGVRMVKTAEMLRGLFRTFSGGE